MSNYDEIRLTGIGGYGYHGVLATERQEGQPFHADLVLYVDTAQAARDDDLAHTADYASVAQAVVDVIEGEPVNLIETLAARIADAVLARGVAKVDVTVHKPQAPLGVAFSDVQVRITRTEPTGASSLPAGPGEASLPAGASEGAQVASPVPDVAPAAVAPSPESNVLNAVPDQPVTVVLGLGGNEGDVRHTLREAVADIDSLEGVEVAQVSALARTVAVVEEGAEAQPDYLNAVVVATTTLSPHQLLAAVNQVEQTHGRVRTQRWGQRTLDIDIITYGDVVASDDQLTIPHPRAGQRAFVLVPWAQLDPTAVIPGDAGGVVGHLAEAAPDRAGVRWLALDWLEDDTSTPTASPDLSPPAHVPAHPQDALSQPVVPDQPEAADQSEAPAQPEVPDQPEAPSQPEAPIQPEPVESSGHDPVPPAPQTPAPPAVPQPPAAPAAAVPPAPPAAAVPPAVPAPPAPPASPGPGEQTPAVVDWLEGHDGEEPQYQDAQPALPVEPDQPHTPQPHTPQPHTPQPSAPQPGAPQSHTHEGGEHPPQPSASEDAPGVEWLSGEEHPPPLSAQPQWLRVRRDE